METNFNVVPARLMHQEHYSCLYHGKSPGVPSRADPVQSFRAESAVRTADGQAYGTLNRDHFLEGSAGELTNGNGAVLPSVDRNDDSVDERQRFANGSSLISNIINASARVLDWTRSEQPGELVSEAEYRELDDGDGGSSNGSQSDGSDEEDEDDGDADGEGEDIDCHLEGTQLADHTMPRICEASGSLQNKGAEGTKQDSNTGLHSSESLEKSNFDRELSSGACTSSAPPASVFLSPPSTIPFLSSFSSPACAGPILGQTVGNSAAQNGGLVIVSGVGSSHASHEYFRDHMDKEAVLKDNYDKEKRNCNDKQARSVRSPLVPEAVPIGSAAMQCYSSLMQATAANSQDQANQIVMFSQRKHYEPIEMPLRSALTDPLTGALMDDATILLCGHSFGNESLQRVLENNACISCGAAARREDMAPNHALQLVVKAYRREEQRWKENASRAAKRRRERLEQERQNMGELIPFDFSRYKGVQFPYKVNDKVLIKGNKRTPERFVGRNAIITTQCLNGWYVVRTLDNGESVKLQYRSLTRAEE